ncbi:M16 family metallopeptidase [Xanthovirga aplysinae]|uniref:M16 family metallopeptidase n=1 Tax=Xanthovirga aplysinae TaxID=2529853 RepID=UPI0012BB9EBA|nr:pitrilysin family protein [Xanthovirga aplysinae]MTI31684.1 insulinase family protein [Xanthovirga aplysinae]
MKKFKYTLSFFCALFLMAISVSGQEIVELKKPLSNKIVIKLMFKNGSITDPDGKEGLTFLTSNLMTDGGTAELTKSQIDDKIYPMAASYWSLTDKEVSTFTFEVPKDYLEEFYPILRDLMVSPSFSEEDFNRLKSNQLNYVEQVVRASSDEEYSKKALEDFLFRGTNFQHMKQGTASSVKAITLDDVKAHYNKWFNRHNFTIGIAGNYSQDFLNKLKADMNKLSDENPEMIVPGKAEMPDGMRVEIVSKKNALGSAIFTGFPLEITRANDDFAAMMIANSWMGEHRKSYSRLYQKIRQTRSMNYGDYTYIEWYEQGGSYQLPLSGVPRSSNYTSIWIRPVQIAESLQQQYPELKEIKVGHAHFALRMAIREMDLLIANGLSQEDFELTKKFLRSYIKLYIQTPEKELGFLMDSRFYGRQDYIKEIDALLAKVTLDEVNQAIKKYWQTDNMCVTIITDDSEAKPLAESIRKNLPSPMSYSQLVKEGLGKEILQEDDEVAKYPLNVKEVVIINDADTFSKTDGVVAKNK